MANSYTQFSFAIPLEPTAIQTFRDAEALIDAVASRQVYGGTVPFHKLTFSDIVPGANEASVSEAVRNVAIEMGRIAYSDARDPEQIDEHSLWRDADLHFEYTKDSVCVYAEEFGNVEAAANVCVMAQDCLGAGPLAFEWAEICSRPVPGEFGGGAALIVPGKAPQFMNTGGWIADNFPTADPEADKGGGPDVSA